MDKKLIFFDIDSTIISYKNEEHIPEKTVSAIKQLKKNGHTIAIATGRSYYLSTDILDMMNIDYAVLHNGAQVVMCNESIYEKRIGKRLTNRMCNEIMKTTLYCFAFDGLHIYESNISEESRDYIKKVSGRNDLIKPLYELSNSIFSMNLYGDSAELFNLFKTIKSIYVSDDLHEITSAGISKGKGIRRLTRLLNMDIKDVISVGDGINDLDMPKASGVTIAVGNACKEFKAVADIVTDDIDDGGILNAFKKLKLI